MTNPKVRFKLSPELSDGDHWVVVDTLNDVLQAIQDWYDNDPDPVHGDSFTVQIVKLTDAEVEVLPEL